VDFKRRVRLRGYSFSAPHRALNHTAVASHNARYFTFVGLKLWLIAFLNPEPYHYVHRRHGVTLPTTRFTAD